MNLQELKRSIVVYASSRQHTINRKKKLFQIRHDTNTAVDAPLRGRLFEWPFVRERFPRDRNHVRWAWDPSGDVTRRARAEEAEKAVAFANNVRQSTGNTLPFDSLKTYYTSDRFKVNQSN